MKKYHSIIGNRKCESRCVCVYEKHFIVTILVPVRIKKKSLKESFKKLEAKEPRRDENCSRRLLLREHPIQPLLFIKI